MPRKLLATLKVYEDMETTPDKVSALSVDGGGQYSITLVPNSDALVLPEARLKENRPTILAHELGHFVALVTRDSTHVPPVDLLSHVPGEFKAWELATKMVPDINKAVANYALGDTLKLEDPYRLAMSLSALAAKGEY